MNKKRIFIIGFLIILFGTAFIQYKNTLPKPVAVTAPIIVSNQVITFEGTKKIKLERIKAGSTALQLLKLSHKITSSGKGEYVFVTSIDGVTAAAEKNEFWAFYVNGKQSQVGAGTYRVKNNDTIEWKIETY